MKRTTIEKIEKEIDEKTKLPDDIKDNIRKEVFTNIIVAAIIIIYFIFIVLGSVGSIKNVRAIDLNIFSIVFLTIAIILFEIAYRKENGKLAIHGIESLVVAIFTLFLPYIIFELDETHKRCYLMSSIYIAIYYVIKSIYISTKIKSEYMNNISDVKEIVKKEKSKRKVKDDIEDKSAEKNETNEINNKEEIKIDIPKEKERPQKENAVKTTKKSKNENSEPKRRGRPKKIENKQVEDKVKENKTPKKRGRPRKVVANND